VKKVQEENRELCPDYLDNFDANIIKSRFGFKEGDINKAVPSLILTLKGLDIDTFNVAFSTGNGWQIVDGGHRVEHSGNRKNFVNASTIGRLITRVTQRLGLRMWERGNPAEADVWIGLKFHWMLEEIDFVKELPEEISGKFIHLMPNEFLGGYEFSNVSPEEELLRLTKSLKTNIPRHT
jgi:hypothetical protein